MYVCHMSELSVPYISILMDLRDNMMHTGEWVRRGRTHQTDQQNHDFRQRPPT